MAGSPLKTRILRTLLQRARTMWPDDDTRTELDWVAQYQASGGFITTLAQELECSPAFIRETLRVKFGAETVRETLARAREDGAHQLAEDAGIVADAADEKEIGVARLRVHTKQWLAEKWNRREFGNDKSVAVQVTVGALMLDALRAPSAIATAIAEPAEVLSIEPATTSDVDRRTTNTTDAGAQLEAGPASQPADGADSSAG